MKEESHTESQNQRVLETLLTGVYLTSWYAIHQMKITRLAARCRELRKRQWPIKTKLVKQGRTRIAMYFL